MGVLLFDGVDDRLRWTTLATALANVSDGAWTMAVLSKRRSVNTWDAISYLLSGGAAAAEAGLSHNLNNDDMSMDLSGTSVDFAGTFTDTASPYMFVVSKGEGTVIPRLAWKLGSGGAWTHVNASGNIADQVASDTLDIGNLLATTDWFDGWIGLVAFWEGAMSDVNKEALDNNWRTSDWWNSAHGQPAFLAELDVLGASVIDLAGNASALTATGTSLDSGETLQGWNFDGTDVQTMLPTFFQIHQFG